MGSTKQISDFIVKTNGHCFLCLRKTTAQLNLVKVEPGLVNETSYPIYPFQCVSRYLKLEMRKVFSGDTPIPHHLLTKVQRSTLKVELCNECAVVNEKFSEIFRQLEKLQMEVTSWLKEILAKLKVGEEAQATEAFGGMAQLGVERLHILEALRKETMQNCSNKLRQWTPRIRLERRKGTTTRSTLQNKQRGKKSQLKDSRNVNGSHAERPDDDPNQLRTGIPVVILQKLEMSKDRSNYTSKEEDTLSHTNHQTISEVNRSPSPESMDDNEDDDPDYDASQGTGTPYWQDQDVWDGQETCVKSEAEEDVAEMDEDNRDVDAAIPITNPSAPPPPPQRTKSSGIKVGSLKNRCTKASKGKFKCKACSKLFKFYLSFSNHYRAQHLKLRYTCPTCDKQFTQLQNYKYHQKQTHKDIDKKNPVLKPLTTVEKTKSPGTELKIRKFKENYCKSSTGKFKCKHCSKLFNCYTAFHHHYLAKHLKLRYTCPTCGKQYTTMQNCRIHQKLTHGDLNRMNPVTQLPSTDQNQDGQPHHSSSDPKDGEISGIEREASGDVACSKPESDGFNDPSSVPGSSKKSHDGHKSWRWKNQSFHKKGHQYPVLLKKKSPVTPTYPYPYSKHRVVIKPQPINPENPDESPPQFTFNSETGKYCCSICPKEFANEKFIQVHCRKVHTTLRFKCSLCAKEFKNRWNFRIHFQALHLPDMTRYKKCEYCPRSFKTTTGINKHKKICPWRNGRPEGHPTSGASIDLSQNLEETATAEGKPKCIYCSKEFLTQNSMLAHHARCHMTNRKCTYCGLDFEKYEDLRQHVEATHLTCEHCGKIFGRLSILTEHVNAVHLKIKEHVCHQCGMAFSIKSSLTRHTVQVHLGVKEHVCDQCGKRFAVLNCLRKHVIMVHLKERKQVCDLCGRSFCQKTTLNRHIKALHPGAPMK